MLSATSTKLAEAFTDNLETLAEGEKMKESNKVLSSNIEQRDGDIVALRQEIRSLKENLKLYDEAAVNAQRINEENNKLRGVLEQGGGVNTGMMSKLEEDDRGQDKLWAKLKKKKNARKGTFNMKRQVDMVKANQAYLAAQFGGDGAAAAQSSGVGGRAEFLEDTPMVEWEREDVRDWMMSMHDGLLAHHAGLLHDNWTTGRQLMVMSQEDYENIGMDEDEA